MELHLQPLKQAPSPVRFPPAPAPPPAPFEGRFELRPTGRMSWEALTKLDTYLAAQAYVNGDIEVDGDLVSAVAAWWKTHEPSRLDSALAWLAERLRPERWYQTRAQARRNVEFHYDRSNEFYRTFLDRRMVYSCAYFANPHQSLEAAQDAKLDLICRKLGLTEGERFLDVGCGWGALMSWAVERYGVRAVGCTLSREQHRAAIRLLGERGLRDQASVELCDYRDVNGCFSKIASIGMIEHVGRSRLDEYFKRLASLLVESGLLLNQGITRPAGVSENSSSAFLRRQVFPGGELIGLDELTAAAERAGFEMIDVENLRPHYALTCRAWVARLRDNREASLGVVDARTYRTWLLYLAASAASFEGGTTDVHQIVMARRSPKQRRGLRFRR